MNQPNINKPSNNYTIVYLAKPTASGKRKLGKAKYNKVLIQCFTSDAKGDYQCL
ncbi:hypothetical protein GCM10007414_35570 [Agarivorans gilvus]|uniref:Uncharacterized protein n=1 Tax=Agarivorans gilvus TaxID=680279 RepID=A0ABQ1I6W6_9ALTE|nr:hypothetical protein GCM10007414_35570 [Agarivorans gilvus]